MKTKLMNKKGVIAPLFIVLFIFISLIFIYLLLYIPLPFFEKGRVIINYFLIVILWIIIQVGLLYGYYKLGTLFLRVFNFIKTKVLTFSLKIKNYLIIHT